MLHNNSKKKKKKKKMDTTTTLGRWSIFYFVFRNFRVRVNLVWDARALNGRKGGVQRVLNCLVMLNSDLMYLFLRKEIKNLNFVSFKQMD